MATEDDIAQLKEEQIQQRAAAHTMLGIVQGIDSKVDELTGAMRSLQVQSSIVDARLTAVDGRIGTVEARLGAVENRLGSVETKLGALAQDMSASFRQIEATVASKEDLAGVESRLSGRMDTLETRMVDSFKQMLAILDERLPKQGE